MDEYSILKKKQKKNAFAATALLISIAIALLVMVGAVFVLNKVNDNDYVTTSENSTGESTKKDDSTEDITCEGLVKEIVFNDNIQNIKEAAINYFTNERLPQAVGDTKKITLKEMKDKKLVLNVRDSAGTTCDDTKSYVEVTKEEDEYVMKVMLSCSNMEDYIIVHLGCYDYCDKDVCEKEVPKEYEYEYKKVTSCIMSPWSDWGKWKLTREKTSSYKKEDIKVETTTVENNTEIDAIANESYNCDKYPGYDLVGDKCVKETTITDTKDATPSEYSYSCDKYPGYDLVGDKCVKETTKKIEIEATEDPITYKCPSSEYNLVGKKCERMVPKKEVIDATPTCPKGYTLNSSKTKCTKPSTKTVTETAKAVYSTKKEYFTCYKDECTTKLVFSCPEGKPCGSYPQRSCERVRRTCSRDVSYISKYECTDDTYKLTQDKDGNYICTKEKPITLEKTPTPKCPSKEYTLSNGKCIRVYEEKESIDAKENPRTYTCPEGYDKVDKKCIKYETDRDEKTPERIPGGYVCPDGYTQEGKTCTKVTTKTDKEDATKVTTYTCPKGFDKKDKTCIKKGTETVTTTYYRYATRTCDGGNTDTRWSTSANDTTLISEGYKLTGKKREIIIK